MSSLHVAEFELLRGPRALLSLAVRFVYLSRKCSASARTRAPIAQPVQGPDPSACVAVVIVVLAGDRHDTERSSCLGM